MKNTAYIFPFVKQVYKLTSPTFPILLFKYLNKYPNIYRHLYCQPSSAHCSPSLPISEIAQKSYSPRYQDSIPGGDNAIWQLLSRVNSFIIFFYSQDPVFSRTVIWSRKKCIEHRDKVMYLGDIWEADQLYLGQ
jgi:hypothetical protein